METIQAIQGRKSIRAYLPKPVPREVITQVLEASRWSPSGSNRQGWQVTVVSGETRRALSERLVERARARERRLSGTTGAAPEVVQRVDSLRAQLGRAAEALGQSRQEFVVIGSYRLYDAPVVIVVSQRGPRTDAVPIFVTTLLVAAHDQGLGTCWLGYPLSESDVIREMLDIPEEERVAAVVALGYPDPDSPANAFRSERDAVDSFSRWVGYD